MKTPSYFEAAIPEPFRILGLTLKPLSLGRYRLLKRFDCAFVADEEKSATIPDLIIGVLICSMRCDEFLKWAQSPDFGKDIRKWSKRVVQIGPIGWIGRWLIPPLGRWWRKRHSFCAVEKMQLFQRYIREGQVIPKFWINDDGGESSGSHWAHSVETVLRAQGWSGEEIDEEPLNRALADYFKFAESKGMIRLMSDEELLAIEEGENGS